MHSTSTASKSSRIDARDIKDDNADMELFELEIACKDGDEDIAE